MLLDTTTKLILLTPMDARRRLDVTLLSSTPYIPLKVRCFIILRQCGGIDSVVVLDHRHSL